MHFNFLLLTWICGIAAVAHNWPWLKAIAMVAVAILLCFKLAQKLQFVAAKQPFFRVMYYASSAIIIFALAQSYASHRVEQRLANTQHEVQAFHAIVYVHKMAEQNRNGLQQVVLRMDMAQPQQYVLQLKHDLLSAQTSQGLALGRFYEVQGILKPAHGYAVPHVFDIEKWYLTQNWQGRVKVKQIQNFNPLTHAHSVPVHEPSFFLQWQVSVEQLRLNFRQQLLATPLQHRGLMLALLTGDRSLIPPNTEQLFVRFGISHLLAISGPHVLMLGIMVSLFLAFIINRLRPTWYLLQPRPLLLILPFVLSVVAYSAFVGFEIPALRTLLSVLIVSVVLCMKLHVSALRIVLLSASVLLLFDPLSILSVAFWLSYGACFVLLRVYQTLALQKPLPHQQRVSAIKTDAVGKFLSAVYLLWQTQWRIFVALLPIVLWSFAQVAWIAPLTNLIAIPVIAMLVVPLNIVAALIAMLFPSLAALIWQFTDLVLHALMLLLQAFDLILQPQLSEFALQPMHILAVAMAVILLFLPRGVVPKFWIILCLMPLLTVLQPNASSELTVIDVGQGQSVLIRDAKSKILIDTGGYYDESIFSLGEKVLLPFLRGEGIHNLQQVILSHLDQDHSGAFPALQQGMPIQSVQSNQAFDYPLQAQFSLCNAGQTITSEQFRLTILLPNDPEPEAVIANQNEYSCVVYVQFLHGVGYQNFLIMGDAGFAAEAQMMLRYPDLNVDVLVLGHHGSRHSSSDEFLKHYRPKLAIASAGFDNRYGHPSNEVLQRLTDLHIPLLTTATSGSIRFYPDQSNDLVKNPVQFRHSKTWLQRTP